jgi:hypothetical protein
VALEVLGEKVDTLISEVRAMRAELSAMRSEIDGGFRRGAEEKVEGLSRIVDAQHITTLERSRT